MCLSNTAIAPSSLEERIVLSSLKERIVLAPSSIGNQENIPVVPFVKRETNTNNKKNINNRNEVDVSPARKLRRMKRRLLLEYVSADAGMQEMNSI
jgi:hypothetical protein